MSIPDFIVLFAASYYLYLEAGQSGGRGKKAIINTPAYTPATTSDVCFISFYYNMYGAQIGSLKFATTLGSTDKSAFCRTGQQQSNGVDWQRGLLWVRPAGKTFRVRRGCYPEHGAGENSFWNTFCLSHTGNIIILWSIGRDIVPLADFQILRISEKRMFFYKLQIKIAYS